MSVSETQVQPDQPGIPEIANTMWHEVPGGKEVPEDFHRISRAISERSKPEYRQEGDPARKGLNSNPSIVLHLDTAKTSRGGNVCRSR